MKAQKLLTTKVKIPELILENKRVGKNKLVQLAQKEELAEVDVYPYKPDVFLLLDKLKSPIKIF